MTKCYEDKFKELGVVDYTWLSDIFSVDHEEAVGAQSVSIRAPGIGDTGFGLGKSGRYAVLLVRLHDN